MPPLPPGLQSQQTSPRTAPALAPLTSTCPETQSYVEQRGQTGRQSHLILQVREATDPQTLASRCLVLPPASAHTTPPAERDPPCPPPTCDAPRVSERLSSGLPVPTCLGLGPQDTLCLSQPGCLSGSKWGLLLVP